MGILTGEGSLWIIPFQIMDFNTRLSSFFLHNNRLTVLCLLFLVLLGVGSALLLKTTGFPSPDLKFASIQTLYFGASSETVAQEVTAPLEAAIRDVPGVHSFTSTSNNSFSFIGVTVADGFETDTVVTKLNAALSSVQLPEGSEEPEVSVPSIAGPDILYSLVSKDEEELYNLYESIEAELLQIPETAQVAPLTAIEKRLLIILDQSKMASLGLTAMQVQQALSSFGEVLPVASDLDLDGENRSLLTRLDEEDLEDIKNLSFGVARLKDFAKIDWDYAFVGDKESFIGIHSDGDALVLKALHFQVKAVKNTDMGDYTEQVEAVFEELGTVQLVKNFEFEEGFEQALVIEDYSVNNDNKRQVEEVVAGLIGGELHGDAPWSYAGWFLGGMQLVFLVMVLFVSFRAAIVAALAIPLSLMFSTLFVYAIGENLNTLVLFSLVLAIGLVVDPALVLLESIQRKVDTGLRGKEAAIAAVKDTGMGLFLACLTSIIVFVPFGVVSGILGQIIAYIPMTIIPAVVGSYIVPLVFLAWMGGFFLKPNPKKTGDEEENLWGVAKLVIAINEWVLNHSRFLRFLIILVALVVPLMVAGYSFQSGAVKSVQFASSDNADYLQLGFVHKSDTSASERVRLEKKVLKTIVANEEVLGVFPMPGDVYMALLKPALERGDTLSVDIAEDLNEVFADSLLEDFFDLQIGVISNGPPTANYQIALALKSSDLQDLQKAAQEVGGDLENLCFESNAFSMNASCEGERVITKVDDGYAGKETSVIEVILDREKLQAAQLTIPGAPLTAYVNAVLRNLFSINNGDAVGKITVDGKDLDIVLEKMAKDPVSIDEIKNTVLFAQGETVLRLKDIASIEEKQSQSSIQRVNGETIAVVKGRLTDEHGDPGSAAMAAQVVLDFYEENPLDNGVEMEQYSEGDTAGFIRSFQELFTALALAIVITYVVLVVFFESFTQPLVILYTVPLTFLGVFPALALFGGGQFGFLEIIGLIILVGVVENVAIFLIDAAKQKIHEGWDEVRAISYASGVRFRAVILTKLTALASLAPLAVLSEQYRSISLVIMFGLLTSGITSLFTTPILFIFFRSVSAFVRGKKVL
jgi:HAE1 family hydrophobic/amphiphilic exporter-1